jgi:hypothetical protein
MGWRWVADRVGMHGRGVANFVAALQTDEAGGLKPQTVMTGIHAQVTAAA